MGKEVETMPTTTRPRRRRGWGLPTPTAEQRATAAAAREQRTESVLATLPTAQAARARAILNADTYGLIERMQNGLARVETHTRAHGRVTSYVTADGRLHSRTY
jgi:hypothetical protein